jgi:translocon-associated protein subunit alpha
LTVWVNVVETGSNEVHQITAFNQTVSVVEPQSSWCDPQLLFLYLVLASALAGGAYLLYDAFFAQPARKTNKPRKVKAVVVAEKGKAYPDVKPYEEEWIPEQHLKNRASKLKKSGATSGGASSGGEDLLSGGDVTSGGEISEVETKSPKANKKKNRK